MEFKSKDILFEPSNHNNLIIIFGGIRNGVGIPIFEFKKILSEYENFDQLFLRDIQQMWYHKGIVDYANNIDELKFNLKSIISSYNKVIFIGNSMGGFIAILLGILLNVNTVLAFSPQTFIDKFRRFYFNDKRWFKQINNLHNNNINNKYYNLKLVLKKSDYNTNINLIYSTIDRLDSIHATRLSRLSNVKLKGFDFGGHSLVSDLKNKNILRQILDEYLL